jgi:hypothetical protein
MSGKYVDGGKSGATFSPGPDACGDGQATAFDAVSGACFKMYGLGVTIGSSTASFQGGFEVCNLNFHSSATQRALVNPFQL